MQFEDCIKIVSMNKSEQRVICSSDKMTKRKMIRGFNDKIYYII